MPQPYRIADDTYVIPHFFPVPGMGYINANSMVITGKEPVIVDTGPAVVRSSWLEQVRSVVDLEDVRWIFLSHDDGDHIGNLGPVLDACPNARLVTGWFMTGRLGLDHGIELPMPRCVWINDGDSFDAGDRTLHAIRPPVFDAPTTRGLFDSTTGVYWASDAFGQFLSQEVYDAADVPEAERWEMFGVCNTLISPWHQWLDRDRFGAHVDAIERLGVETIATCHGPVATGALAGETLRRIRDLPAMAPYREPGQPVLEHILAEAMQAEPAAAAAG